MTVRWWEDDASTIADRLASRMTTDMPGKGKYTRTPWHKEQISEGIQEARKTLDAWGRALSEE